MHKLSSILHFVIGISALVSGIGLMIDSRGTFLGLSTTLLVNGPFENYRILGIIVVIIFGLGNLLGWWAGHRNHVYTASMSLIMGILLLIATLFESWVFAEFYPWLQLLAIIGTIQLLWGWVLRRDFVARTNSRRWHGKRA